MDLSSRVNNIIRQTAKIHHISLKQLCEDWLNEIIYPLNTWECIRDSGLCGSFAPRGVIFTMILKRLYTYFVDESPLFLANRFCKEFNGDAGLDGCLLEIVEILKLKDSYSLDVAILCEEDNKWSSYESCKLPSVDSKVKLWIYREPTSNVVENCKTDNDFIWHLIQIPTCFDVIDVVLVKKIGNNAMIYGIQITRSEDPFANHHTFDTCSEKSKIRLEKLWNSIRKSLTIDKSSEHYVMVAPNCINDKFKPPAEHKSNYFFSPAKIVEDYNCKPPMKRIRSEPVTARRKRGNKNVK